MPSAAFWRAWSVWAVTVALAATAVGYAATHPLPASLASFDATGLTKVAVVVFIAAFATVGALLAWKRPPNPIGWLMSAIALAYTVAVFSMSVLPHFHRTLTLASWLGWIFFVGIGLCVFVVLLFPTGRLPSRRWRPVAWAGGAGLTGWVLGNAFAPTIISVSPSMRNPVGLTGLAGDVFTIMAKGGAALIAGAGAAALVSLAFRYRRAGMSERAQLKWLVYAGVLVLAVVLIGFGPVEQIMGSAANNLQNVLVTGAVALVPVAIAIAVLRYRLYDIDRFISRTVAYAIITGLLAGVYAGLVLLATEVFGLHTPVAVAAATLAAAAMFSPVRRRVQARVDRRFNRAGYDAETMVAAFATRLKDAVDLEAIRDDLASVVQTALEPAHLRIWLSQRD